jgi:AAA domain
VSAITFRPGLRENVGLWINLIGGTGSGKSYSGMLLAKGIAGDKPFAVIDSENRRALHYADQFRFDHAEIRAPFRPDTYAEAALAADAAGYPVVMIDSGSHVWAGDGGVLDWQEDELQRMAGDDYKKREACKMSAWIKPKMAHKQMVNKLLQVKAHIVFCLRAEPKIEMVKVDGKWAVQPKQSLTGLDGWIPVCEKNLPFEATASFLLMADRPGVPYPIKLQEQHRALFPLGVPITEESGRRLSEWAKGGKESAGPVSSSIGSTTRNQAEPGSADQFITADQTLALEARCNDHGIRVDVLKKAAKVDFLSQILATDYDRANGWITAAIAVKEKARAKSTD